MIKSFCRILSDVELRQYSSLEKMLEDNFYPGNYNPTQDQAKQLIRAAAISAIQWDEIHRKIDEVNSGQIHQHG